MSAVIEVLIATQAQRGNWLSLTRCLRWVLTPNEELSRCGVESIQTRTKRRMQVQLGLSGNVKQLVLLHANHVAGD